MKKSITNLILILLLPLLLILTGCPDDPGAPGSTNTLPTGSAGIGKTVLVGETVIIEGIASDPDADDTLTFQWSILSLPSGSSISDSNITNPTTLNASFTTDSAGDYVVQLTISDGTDSVTGQATVSAVGYAIGLNDNNYEHAAYIHNDEFHPLPNPSAPTVDECWITKTRLIGSEVYTVGSHRYSLSSGNLQPVFWKNTTYTTEPGENLNDIGIGIALASDGNVHMLTDYDSEVDDINYWVQNTGYLDPPSAISTTEPWDEYVISEVVQVGTDIFQYGMAYEIEVSSTHFLAKNLVEIIHTTSFNPDPETDSDFVVHGSLVVPAVPESESQIYMYGRYRQGDNFHAGYVVNGGSWVDLADPGYVEGGNRHIAYMASVSDYILAKDNGDDWAYAVFVDGSEYSMEAPYDGVASVNIMNLDYVYMEEISGSIFVAGGYRYADDMANIYNVAAVWRDGVIVYESYDDDFEDGLDYNNATIAGADFE